MTTLEISVLLGAAVLAGGLNAVAGGGSFVSFPALLLFQYSPVSANATNAVATWPGLITGTLGYRRHLRPHWKAISLLSLISIAGGVAGGLLVLVTPVRVFAYLVPFLMLAGVALLVLGPRFVKRQQELQTQESSIPNKVLDSRSTMQFLVALYGGYFVGGAGILQMAIFSAFGIRDIQLINGLKNALGVVINGAAVVTFILFGQVLWPQAVIMTAGSLGGGYLGALLAQKLSQRVLRFLIIAFGLAMTFYFFFKFYLQAH